MKHHIAFLMTIYTVLVLHGLPCFGQHTKFPKDFIFGVATAAHQIEGAWNVSGKSENIWDRLAHTHSEFIADGTNGDIAVDSYHRFPEDVEELKYLGVDFYQLSLSWSRILPTGRADFINPDGLRYYNELFDLLDKNNIKPWKFRAAPSSYHRFPEDVEELKYLGVDFYQLSLSWSRILPTGRADFINPDGLRYYNELFDLLDKNNIKPWVSLFHWDLPQVLQDLGGFANPIIIRYFEDYARVCFETFGDRVKSWITVNEPYEVCEDAYGDIIMAPAIDSHGVGTYLCSENLLKAHAKAYHVYDKEFRPNQKGEIMISINSIWYEPKDQNDEEQVSLAQTANQFKVGWFAHPIFSEKGGFPQVMIDNIAKNSKEEGLTYSRLPELSEEWIELIKGTSDQLGINHYTTYLITGPGVDPFAKSPSWLKDIGAVTSLDIGENSASAWLRVVPYGFRNLLRWCKKEYNDPRIMINENGVSDHGDVLDYDRITYYNNYLSELLKAIYDDGVKVTGYTAWTLMDSFEWRAGFSHHFIDNMKEPFGFYRVDITDPSLPRTAKLSAEYYKTLLERRELVDDNKFKKPQVP